MIDRTPKYRTGTSPDDMIEWLREYTEDDSLEVHHVKCQNCGNIALEARVDGDEGAIQYNCPECGTKKILLDGEDIWAKPKEIRSVRFRVGLVMQYPEAQLFEETIRADIAFGPKNMGLSADEIAERVSEAARFVGLDEELLDKSPFDLSGGQKRRAAIAGIIAMRPEVLILDEPAAGLDPAGREAVFANIMDYKKETGATVIIVSHSMEDMARYCDDIVVMSEGRVMMQGNRDTVFADADKLGEAGSDIPQITKLMIALKNRGVQIDRGIYTPDAAYRALAALFGK